MWSGVSNLIRTNSPKLRLIRHFCATQEVVVDKAALSKLRKKTGFQLIKCKNALQQFNNDIKQAESWMREQAQKEGWAKAGKLAERPMSAVLAESWMREQAQKEGWAKAGKLAERPMSAVLAESWMREQAQKEGWAKAGKLAERPMSAGLVGLIEDENSATIVEVNCETDFVGKTEQFQTLVKQVAQTCHTHFTGKDEVRLSLGKEASDLNDQQTQKNLGDLVALLVGNMGENMLIRRAAFIQKEPSTIIKTYVHDSGPKLEMDNCKLGKFAAIVKIEVPNINTIASEVCQHIVGMNPKTIGQWETPKFEKGKQKKKKPEGDGKNIVEKEEEESLLSQEFLLDSDKTVKQYLQHNAPRVVDFVRLQCGEVLEDED